MPFFTMSPRRTASAGRWASAPVDAAVGGQSLKLTTPLKKSTKDTMMHDYFVPASSCPSWIVFCRPAAGRPAGCAKGLVRRPPVAVPRRTQVHDDNAVLLRGRGKPDGKLNVAGAGARGD